MSQFEQIPDNGLSPLAREHGFKIVFPSGAGGLSPLAREHASMPTPLRVRGGLSPLARGTRANLCAWGAFLAVYPRWRGEHTMAMREKGGRYGLSPLARGTQFAE